MTLFSYGNVHNHAVSKPLRVPSLRCVFVYSYKGTLMGWNIAIVGCELMHCSFKKAMISSWGCNSYILGGGSLAISWGCIIAISIGGGSLEISWGCISSSIYIAIAFTLFLVDVDFSSKMFVLCFFVMLTSFSGAHSVYYELDTQDSKYAECGTKKSVLLQALFETGDNMFQLGSVFFPARQSTSRYIQVNYFFNGTNCNVTYYWALGAFLLVQPPTIFQFTSLLFSTPANNLTNLNLTLPRECLSLVDYNEDNDSCKCISNDTILTRFTEQVTMHTFYLI